MIPSYVAQHQFGEGLMILEGRVNVNVTPLVKLYPHNSRALCVRAKIGSFQTGVGKPPEVCKTTIDHPLRNYVKTPKYNIYISSADVEAYLDELDNDYYNTEELLEHKEELFPQQPPPPVTLRNHKEIIAFAKTIWPFSKPSGNVTVRQDINSLVQHRKAFIRTLGVEIPTAFLPFFRVQKGVTGQSSTGWVEAAQTNIKEAFYGTEEI